MIGKLFSNWQNYPLEGDGSYTQKYLTSEQMKKKIDDKLSKANLIPKLNLL